MKFSQEDLDLFSTLLFMSAQELGMNVGALKEKVIEKIETSSHRPLDPAKAEAFVRAVNEGAAAEIRWK
ncbi:hypothetical protein [Paracidovorax oryzae]|uniref:hypothetical protein n=1 Tax=Paracidovorax oryzae TaxID=862720 RepID=UPI0035CEEA09